MMIILMMRSTWWAGHEDSESCDGRWVAYDGRNKLDWSLVLLEVDVYLHVSSRFRAISITRKSALVSYKEKFDLCLFFV